MALRNILIIEDDADTRESLSALLELSGFDVCAAATALEGARLAESQATGILILDLGLSGYSGLDVIRKVRAHRDKDALLIIVLTGWCDAQHEADARAAGCDHFLAKPVAFHALLSLLGHESASKSVVRHCGTFRRFRRRDAAELPEPARGKEPPAAR